MAEFGLFNDEGCVENGFGSPEAAAEARDDRYDPEDELAVLEVCDQHPEHPKDYCEMCEYGTGD